MSKRQRKNHDANTLQLPAVRSLPVYIFSIFSDNFQKLYCSLLGEEPKTSDFESEFLMLLSHTQLNLLLQESLPSQ